MSEFPFSSVLSGLAEGILAVDERRNILLCNDAMGRLLNRPAEEVGGLPLWDVLRHREIGEMADRALAGGGEETREISLSFPSEALWQVRARPVPRGAVLTFSDVTHLRRLEVMRRDFVANVSHELKTPLTALRAALETLLEGALEDKSHAREFLETAQSQVDRLQRLIDDLLILARLVKVEGRALEPAETPVLPAANKVLKALEPMARKSRIDLRADLPSEDFLLRLSADELTQVLMNLLDNAIKFNHPEGRVLLQARPAGASAEIAVEDTGIGIPPDDQPRVFERFYRVDKARSREQGGTGLGLAIVKHIVENRQGSIQVQSEPGRGSRFTVILPLKK